MGDRDVVRMHGAVLIISIAFFLLSTAELHGRRELGDGSF